MGSQGQLSTETLLEFRRRLTALRAEAFHHMRRSSLDYFSTREDRGQGGDETDQSVAQIEENTFLASQKRWRERLLEIDQALARIENGTFGVCEETEEPIEWDRLCAVPWTRFSIEGAEIREALAQRFAR